MAAPGARASRGARSSPPESGGSGLERPPPGPRRRSASRTVSPSRPRHRSAKVSGRALVLLRCLGPARITWFISEEMEKLMSGASMGSRRKRAGIGATESASRPRRGGERSSGTTSGQSVEAARTGQRHPGFAGTRSLALPRQSSRRRNCAEQLRATDLHARPGDTAAAARSRRTPLARHHVRRRQCLQAASGSNRRRITSEHQEAPARGPAPRSPRPVRLLHPFGFALPCWAQVGQGKVIPGRRGVGVGVLGARLLLP